MLTDGTWRAIPELRRRGRFLTAYTGTTLRDHLGLSRPANQHNNRHIAQHFAR